MSITFGRTVPVLRSFDESKAKEFYVEFLGFEITFEHRFGPDLPLYMGLERGGCQLHIPEHHGGVCPGSSLRIEVTEIDEFQQQLAAKQYRNARPGPPKDAPHGAREMSVTDPFGNNLCFFQEMAEGD